MEDWGGTEHGPWLPDCGEYWEDQLFLQSRGIYQWRRTWEESNCGGFQSDSDWYRVLIDIESEARNGCRPLNSRTIDEVVTDWHPVGGGPSCNEVWEGQPYQFYYAEERTRRVGWTNDRDGVHTELVTDQRSGSRWETGCKPLNWRTVTEVVRQYGLGNWSPSCANTWEDQALTQTETIRKEMHAWRTNDRGDHVEDQYWNDDEGRATRTVSGCKPLNPRFWQNRLARDWYNIGDWSPSPANSYFWENVAQSVNRQQDWEEWRINDRGETWIFRLFTLAGTLNRTVKGTKVPPLNAVQMALPGGAGSVNVGVNGAAGTVTLPNGVVVTGSSGGSGSIAIPSSVIPGGVTINTSGGSVTVTRSSGTTSLGTGGSIDLGGGIVVRVSTTGNATLTIPNGPAVAVGPGGGSISFPGGTSVHVSTSGRVDVDLPPGTPSVITKAVQIGGAILNAGTGHAISVRDAISLILGPLPPNPILDAIDIGVTTAGLVQLGLRQGSDGPYAWLPIYVGRSGVEIVSRDKFMAGSITIPAGVDNLEAEFVNTTTGESLGRYGALLGGGTTKVYGAVADILSDADVESGGQSAEQKVHFVRDAFDARKVQFYALFNSVGTVAVRLWRGSAPAGTKPHQLVAAWDFASWINYVEHWVNGLGFEFPGSPPGNSGGMSYTFAGTGPGSNANRALIRANLIPIFNVSAQVEGFEVMLIGAFEGVKAGLKDDWDTLKLVRDVYLVTNDALSDRLAAEIIDWRDNPVRRAREMVALIHRMHQHLIFEPMQALGSAALEFADPVRFTMRAWQTWDAIRDGAPKAWARTNSFKDKIANAFVGWMDDFGRRMIDGSEKAALDVHAWNAALLGNSLVGGPPSDANALRNILAYSAGYYLGYLGEQVAIGFATGFATKISQVLIKGGAVMVAHLAKKTAAVVTIRMALLKRSVLSGVVAVEMRIAIEMGLIKATRTPFSTQVRLSVIEVVETSLTRSGFDRSQFNLQLVVTRLGQPGANLQRLAKSPGREEQVWSGLAHYFSTLGDTATAGSSKGWLELQERLLKFNGDAFVEDRAAGLLPLWQAEATAEVRTALRDALNGIATRAAQQPANPWVMGTYRDMRAITRGEGHAIEAHHIIEKRHLQNWQLDVNEAPAVILSEVEHDAITAVLQQRLPTGQAYTREQVWAVYQDVYIEAAEWLDAIRPYFTSP